MKCAVRAKKIGSHVIAIGSAIGVFMELSRSSVVGKVRGQGLGTTTIVSAPDSTQWQLSEHPTNFSPIIF